MYGNKRKAVTFSYDDGVTQDIRLIELLNKYGLKSTFNINSGLLGKSGEIRNEQGCVSHNKVERDQVCSIYKGHEIAVHTLTHPNLTGLKQDEIIYQVEEDRKELERLAGYKINGMAYPCGGVNNDDRVAGIIGSRTQVKYARTITENYSFEPQQNLLRFDPTIYHLEFVKLFELAEEFIKSDSDSPQIFYVWGHSYEFDYKNTWDLFEKFCRLISGKEDIFYGTNSEVLLEYLK